MVESSKFVGQFAKELSTNGLLVITTSVFVLNCDHSKDRPNKDSAVRVLELRLLLITPPYLSSPGVGDGDVVHVPSGPVEIDPMGYVSLSDMMKMGLCLGIFGTALLTKNTCQ